MVRFLGSLIVVWLISVAALAEDQAEDQADARPLPAIPRVNLRRLERRVADQLATVQSLLEDVASRPEATAKQRADAFGEFGRLLQAYGYATEAAECYRHSTALQPADLRWAHLLGTAYEAAGRLPEAEAAFRTALRLGEYTATRVRLANVLVKLNKRDEARRLFAELLAADPKLAAAYAGAGMLALEERDFKAAIDHLGRALELVPAATRLHYSLAMAYRGTGDIGNARRHLLLRGDVGIRPDDPWVDELPQLIQGAQVHLMRAKVALAAGALADAIREYRLALEAAPDDVGAHINLAVALIRSGASDEALQHLEAARKLAPRHEQVLFNLASLRLSRSEFAAAAELLQVLLLMQPKDIPARRLLSQAFAGLQQPQKAIDFLRETHALEPDDEETILQLANLLAARQPAESIALLSKASEAHPERGLTAHALARLLASCPDAGLRDGKRALQLATAVYSASPNFEHTETLAMALAAADRFDEAIRLQKQLLSAAENQRAAAILTRIKENLVRYEQQMPAR